MTFSLIRTVLFPVRVETAGNMAGAPIADKFRATGTFRTPAV
ncbi:MAG TPA: hypothetical protein VF212_15920 [Longimicrobiales bacterium]